MGHYGHYKALVLIAIAPRVRDPCPTCRGRLASRLDYTSSIVFDIHVTIDQLPPPPPSPVPCHVELISSNLLSWQGSGRFRSRLETRITLGRIGEKGWRTGV